MPAPSSTVAAASASADRTSRFRPEIEGLRAVAIAMVVASHLWWGRISGGIDVFLLISGFVITSGSVRRWTRTGSVDPVGFLSRIISRLVPSVFVLLSVVLGFTLWLGMQGQPQRATSILGDTAFSAGFVENWYLALNSDGYLADDRVLNPVEHLWALSLQLQLYLLWLLLTVVLAAATRRMARSERVRANYAVLAMAVLGILSLAWAVIETLVNQPVAYFDTSARIWEFAVGGILALVVDRVRMPAWLGAPLGWAGLVGVVSLPFVGNFDVWFPGFASAWPVAGAVLLILGASVGSRVGVQRVLGARPLVWLGGLAFGVYLWHWPLLSAAAILWDHTSWRVGDGLALVGVALGLSWLTVRLIEKPFRRAAQQSARWQRSAIAAAVVLIVAVGTGATSAGALMTSEPPVGRLIGQSPRAQALDRATQASGQQLAQLQSTLAAALAQTAAPHVDQEVGGSSYAELWNDPPGCHAGRGECVTGDPDAPHLAVILGDSSGAAWYPGLRDALGPDWRIDLLARPGCPFAPARVDLTRGADQDCVADAAAAVQQTLTLNPDLVFVSESDRYLAQLSSGATGDAAVAEWRAALAALLAELAPLASRTVVVEPPPWGQELCGGSDFAPGGTRCVSAIDDDRRAFASAQAQVSAAAGVSELETAPWFCSADGECPWNAGSTLIRADGIHITVQYAQQLAGVLRAALVQKLPSLAAAVPSS